MQNGKMTAGTNLPIWFNDLDPRPHYPPLKKDLKTDVCIIGGGISGLTTAYQLLSEGKSVVVLEDGKIGSGESGRTSAHLSNILDDRFYNIKKVHGEAKAKLAAQSHAAAIDFIEEMSKKEKISCEFLRVNGYLFSDDTNKEKSKKILEKEFKITAHFGLKPKMLFNAPESTFDMGMALEFPNQAQFHPVKYLDGLATVIKSKGGKIFENTHAQTFEKGTPLKIKTATGCEVTADYLVVATNSPVNDMFVMHTKQESFRSYVLGSLIPKGSLKAALYWDTADPYHYIRVHHADYEYQNQKYDLLITGGQDHRVGCPEKSYLTCFKDLEKWTQAKFPQVVQTVHAWSGQIIEPVDYLAFIGHNPLDNKNVFIITGDSGNGLTHGTIGGLLISDLILKHKNKWEEVYKPSRKKWSKWTEFVKINALTVPAYLDYLKPQKKCELTSIPPSGGIVIQDGTQKIAVYRDAKGKLHKHCAVCPHLKAPLHWNEIEKTWDCPAHGSRFTGEGVAINGPANSNLKKAKK